MKIAIVGTGQLARMLALAGWPMGMQFSFLADAGANRSCIEGLGPVVDIASEADPAALYQALGCPDLITVEKEQVDVALLRGLQAHCPVYPDPDAIARCQNRHLEKSSLNALGIATAPYCATHSRDEIAAGLALLGGRAILKTCDGGYDGYGQWRLRQPDDLAQLPDAVCNQPCVLEQWLDFEAEVSLLAARSSSGEVVLYPVTENYHRDGTLLTSLAPATSITPELQREAEQIAHTLLTEWNYVGVLAVECFVTAKGLLVNELAPRVHNSGHWTQAAGICSQFENHLRAICGLPLGIATPDRCAGMVNLLGVSPDPAQVSGASRQLHLYNKSLRERRKMGHINMTATDQTVLRSELQMLVAQLYTDRA